MKDPVDGAVPSGNSVAAHNLLYLARHSDQQRDRYLDLVRKTVAATASLLTDSPAATPLLAAAVADYLKMTDTGTEEPAARP